MILMTVGFVALGTFAICYVVLRLFLEPRLSSFRVVNAPRSGNEWPWEKWKDEFYRPDGYTLLRRVRFLTGLNVFTSLLGMTCLVLGLLVARRG